MTTEKSREQFEAWFAEYVKHWPQPSEAIQKIAPDLYWSVWQASRAAVVVELPRETRGMDSYEIRKANVLAIEAAGLKVKS